jgi:hydrogenase maturation protease
MNWPRPIRVVGVGSPLGDDALAWEAVRALQHRLSLRATDAEGIFLGARDDTPEIEFYMLEGGQRILDVLDGCGSLLLVDAAAAGTGPGTIHRFEWPDQRVETLRPGSTHDLRPAEALRLAAALGIAPQHIVVFGMEVESLEPQADLSSSVVAAIPELVRCLLQELDGRPTDEGGLCQKKGTGPLDLEEESPESIGEEH